MSTSVPRPIKAHDGIDITATEFDALAGRARAAGCPTYLGVDGDGRYHFISRVRTEVVVFDGVDDTEPESISLKGRSFAPHIEEISTDVEWTDCRMGSN